MAVEQGTATFYCQHSSSDEISWRVNGTSEKQLNSPNIFSNNEMQGNDRIYSLSIKNISEFYQTTVECVAIFFDSPSQLLSPTVTLLIQGLLNVHLHELMYVSDSCL